MKAMLSSVCVQCRRRGSHLQTTHRPCERAGAAAGGVFASQSFRFLQGHGLLTRVSVHDISSPEGIKAGKLFFAAQSPQAPRSLGGGQRLCPVCCEQHAMTIHEPQCSEVRCGRGYQSVTCRSVKFWLR